MNKEQKIKWLENEISFCTKMIHDQEGYSLRKEMAEKELKSLKGCDCGELDSCNICYDRFQERGELANLANDEINGK